MGRILISGATGLIGAALASSCEQIGMEVVRLVRRKPERNGDLQWDPSENLSPAKVSGFEAVIHLAGETVMGRWTEAKKSAIRTSRVESTKNLANALAQADAKPRSFVCASAVGFYGNRGDEVLTEASNAGEGFLPDVCRQWEAASQAAAGAGIRTANMRTGLVLSADGGALAKMLPVFKLGLGGRIASGNQWWSWIHLDDIVGAVHHIVRTESISGPVNLVAPNPVTNKDFTKTLASVLGRPAPIPVPVFALKAAFGPAAAEEMFLASARVEPQKLLQHSYGFRFPTLPPALENL